MTDIDGNKASSNKNEFDMVASNLRRIWGLLRCNGLRLVIAALLGAVFGFVLTFIVPAEWEASGLVRIGQVWGADSSGKVVELPMVAVDRVKSRVFQDQVLLSLGLSVNEDDDKPQHFRNSLKVRLEKSDLIHHLVRRNVIWVL